MTALEVRQVEFAFPQGFRLQVERFTVAAGELVGVLGPNGSGKTTLLRLAAGTLRPRRGSVLLDGREVCSLPRAEVARRLAVVPQESRLPFAYTVREVVSLGRTPYAHLLAGPTRADRQAVETALELAGLVDLADRSFGELSGGERQRAILAMALAQQPRLLLLDEPTAHLDIAYQLDLLERLRGLNRTMGLTIVATTHDLNLAALIFDRLVLVQGGRIAADGPAAEVLVPERIQATFGARTLVQPHPTTGAPHVIVLPNGVLSPEC
ncbi:MAG: ABC transporter ATP-binding protein [Chloroflexi bacterium]|nr:ABC transporter ATP-binding protein [Chloroflexota bacterium]